MKYLSIQESLLDEISDVRAGIVQKGTFWYAVDNKSTTVNVTCSGDTLVFSDSTVSINGHQVNAGNEKARLPSSSKTSLLHTTCIDTVDDLVAIGNGQGDVQIYDVRLETKLRDFTPGHYTSTDIVKFFPSHKVLLSAGDLRLKLWNIEDGQCIQTLGGITTGVLDLAMIGRGRNLVAATPLEAILFETSTAKTVRKLASGQIGGMSAICPVRGVLNHGAAGGDLDFETEGNALVLGGERGWSYWDLRSKAAEAWVATKAVESVRQLTETSFAALHDGSATIWDCRNHSAPLDSVETVGGTGGLLDVPSATSIVVASSDGCVYHHLNKSHISLTGFDTKITSLSSNSKHLYLANKYGIYIYDK